MLEVPAESDVRFLGYRLDVISRWPASARKLANAEAISRRLTAIARSTLARPDIEDLLHLSCRLLDDFFSAAESRPGYLPSTEEAKGTSTNAPGSFIQSPRAGMPLTDW